MFRLLTISSSHRLPLASPLVRSFMSTPSFALGAPISRPAPPSLPKEQQEEFDRLIREANAPTPAPASSSSDSAGSGEKLATAQSGDSFHPAYRRIKNDFEGEVNPKTGEIGGPKRDPFAAGGADWQYGGRVTDF